MHSVHNVHLTTISTIQRIHETTVTLAYYKRRKMTLQWRHNGCDSVSNHQSHDRLLNRLFRRRSKKTSKLRVTGLCAGNLPVTGEFPAQMTSYAENVLIWWRHHEMLRNIVMNNLWRFTSRCKCTNMISNMPLCCCIPCDIARKKLTLQNWNINLKLFQNLTKSNCAIHSKISPGGSRLYPDLLWYRRSLIP